MERVPRLTVLAMFVLSSVGCWQVVGRLDGEKTIYAPGFSVQKFHSIRIGDSTDWVYEVLGEPLDAGTCDTGFEYWYSEHDLLIVMARDWGSPDWLYYVTSVRNGNGQDVRPDLLGLTRYDISRRFKRPDRRTGRDPVTCLYYSWPGTPRGRAESRSYWRYLIYIDNSTGLVVDKLDELEL